MNIKEYLKHTHISDWDVSNVTDMKAMFNFAISFNQDISRWDVSNVLDMNGMFFKSKYNQELSEWDTCNVKYMDYMFAYSEFKSNISKWKLPADRFKINMFKGSVNDPTGEMFKK